MKQLQIDLIPEEYASPSSVRRAVAQAMGVREDELEPFRITRRSIDCRRRPLYHCTVEVESGKWKVENKEVIAVLDIDSRELNTFDDIDARWLEQIVKHIP